MDKYLPCRVGGSHHQSSAFNLTNFAPSRPKGMKGLSFPSRGCGECSPKAVSPPSQLVPSRIVCSISEGLRGDCRRSREGPGLRGRPWGSPPSPAPSSPLLGYQQPLVCLPATPTHLLSGTLRVPSTLLPPPRSSRSAQEPSSRLPELGIP